MPDSLRLDETEIVREHEPDAMAEAQRVEAAVQGGRQGTRIGLIAGGVILTIAIWLVLMWRAPGDAYPPNACKREHAGFIDIKPSCTEPSSIERQGDIILAYPGTSLEAHGSDLRVRHGKASFVARTRTDGTKLRVLVSHGTIEVTGTRFTVVQEEQGGHVKLDEGVIIFHDDSGGDVTLAPDTDLAWPRDKTGDVVALGAIPLEPPKDAAKETPKEAPKPSALAAAVARAAAVSRTPPPVTGSAGAAPAAAPAEEDVAEEDEPEPTGPMSMEDILKKISSLRTQHRTREAVELLVSQSKRGDITDAQMARLSWEIGLFLQDSGDKAATCNHWKNHARKYPDDAAHADRVQDLIKACDTPL